MPGDVVETRHRRIPRLGIPPFGDHVGVTGGRRAKSFPTWPRHLLSVLHHDQAQRPVGPGQFLSGIVVLEEQRRIAMQPRIATGFPEPHVAHRQTAHLRLPVRRQKGLCIGALELPTRAQSDGAGRPGQGGAEQQDPRRTQGREPAVQTGTQIARKFGQPQSNQDRGGGDDEVDEAHLLVRHQRMLQQRHRRREPQGRHADGAEYRQSRQQRQRAQRDLEIRQVISGRLDTHAGADALDRVAQRVQPDRLKRQPPGQRVQHPRHRHDHRQAAHQQPAPTGPG
jgi:hypothetical protein